MMATRIFLAWLVRNSAQTLRKRKRFFFLPFFLSHRICLSRLRRSNPNLDFQGWNCEQNSRNEYDKKNLSLSAQLESGLKTEVGMMSKILSPEKEDPLKW